MQGPRRSDLERKRRNPAHRGAFTLAAMLAVFLQVFVVEPHVHVANPLSAAIAAGSGSHDSQQHATLPHEQAACLVCQALASAGGALPTAGGALVEPPAASVTLSRRPLHVGPRASAHSWRSRAPPVLL